MTLCEREQAGLRPAVGLLGAHAASFLPPPVIGLIGDAEGPASLGGRPALGKPISSHKLIQSSGRDSGLYGDVLTPSLDDAILKETTRGNATPYKKRRSWCGAE